MSYGTRTPPEFPPHQQPRSAGAAVIRSNRDDNSPPSSSSSGNNELMNPVMVAAQRVLKRVMACQSPDDAKVADLLEDKSELQLAMFVSRTLDEAIKSFKHKESARREKEQQFSISIRVGLTHSAQMGRIASIKS